MDTSSIDEMKAKKDAEGLIKYLEDKDWHIREAAAEALHEIGDDKAIKALVEVALSDENELFGCVQ